MRPEYQMLVTLGGFIIAAYGFYSSLKAKAIEQATKLQAVEIELNYVRETLAGHAKRLDNHDKQNEVMIRMTAQMETLSDKVETLNKKLEHKGF